jgi:aspartyl aminopeptidase
MSSKKPRLEAAKPTRGVLPGSSDFADEFCAFNDKCPTPYHVIAEGRTLLTASGFTELSERASWGKLGPGRYFFSEYNK